MWENYWVWTHFGVSVCVWWFHSDKVFLCMGNKIGVSLFDLGKQHCYWSQSRVYLTYFSKCESSLRLEREKKKKERERE